MIALGVCAVNTLYVIQNSIAELTASIVLVQLHSSPEKP